MPKALRPAAYTFFLLTMLAAGMSTPGPAPAAAAQAPPAQAARAIDPSQFVRRVTNPYMPLKPGTTYVFRGTKDGKSARDIVTVTARTKRILFVRTTVVRDRLYLAGKLAEKTLDFYAQDKKGNVWYFGEVTRELDRKGNVVSTEGSWQGGVDGAKPGIFMPARPRVGESFRQEFLKGHAEDHFRIVHLASPVTVPYGSFRKALETRWTPLEPGVRDQKFYVRGIGVVKELTVKGPQESNVLVSITRWMR